MSDFLQLSLDQLQRFHFLRPEWLWLLVPLLALWVARRTLNQETQWRQVLPPHLAKVLLAESNQNNKIRYRTLLLFWLITTLAMAGPTWQKIEKPVFKVKQASVIVLDMSMSMRATDVKPNRLTKAKFKALDLAQAIPDGDVALVAYAGDAFTISPLTPDARNITALIPSLTPEIMPEQGSHPLAGLEKASELLIQAGYTYGDIYWLTDGIENEDWTELQSFSAASPYRIHILAIGTAQGAPIKMVDGSLLKDHRGSIVIPRITTDALMRLAGLSKGHFATMTANDADIKRLVSVKFSGDHSQPQTNDETELDLTGDDWHEFGPYLLLILIVPFALKFRKGAAMCLLLPILLTGPAPDALASATPAETMQPSQEALLPWYASLFKTSDQRGQEQYASGNYEGAKRNFKHDQWKGSAAYKAGDFDTALEHFSKDNSAQGWYNRGNALAKLNQLDKAIYAYEQALKLAPDMQQAKENKALLEQLKKQQESQEQNNQSTSQNQDGESQDQQQDSEQQQDSQQGQEGNNQQESSAQEQSQQNQSGQSQQDSPQPSTSPEEQSEQSAQEQAAQQKEQEQPRNNQSLAQQDAQQENGRQEESQQMVPLTPEQIAEQEQQQKIQQLLRKVTDDPAVLLRNKMILENRKRQQANRMPKGAKKQW